MNASCLLPFIACLAVGCSSSRTTSREDLGSQTMSKRMAGSMKRMNDPNDRSRFDKDMQASLGGNKSAGWLSRKKYGATKNFNGVKSFNTDSFKTKEFNGSDIQSRMGKQKFGEFDKTSSFANAEFRTGKSSFADKSLRDGSKSFSGANDVFKTRSNREATKSIGKNMGPMFIELDEKERRSAYTEDQVRSLMGRD